MAVSIEISKSFNGFDSNFDNAYLPAIDTSWVSAPQFTTSAAAPITAAAAAPAVLAQGTTGTTSPVGNGADLAMLADQARSSFGVTGAGVKIGILSDSFNIHGGYAADVASGALPGNVEVLKEGPSTGGDEGRAMAELIHQIAPDAQIYFYTAFAGEADFANGISTLAAAGCNVIVDDVTYLDEPFFQDGSAVQNAVAAAVANGVNYFTSASNEGTNFYQHGFTGVSASLPGLHGSYQVENFGTAAQPDTMQSLTITPGSTMTLDLQWDQPFASIGDGAGSADSLGMVLYNAAGKIVASALSSKVGGDPVQTLRFTNTTGGSDFRLALVTNGGSEAPNLFKYIVYGHGVTINDVNAGIGSGSVIGHELTAGANVVGAIAAANAPALGGNGAIEAFSSVGPGRLLFDASGDRLTDAVSGNKVSFIAPDGVNTSVFAPFFGTSAAAPNAAGVAALMVQANPGLSPAQISAGLASSAVAVTGPKGGVGAGLIQAPAAIQAALAAHPTMGSVAHDAVISPAPAATGAVTSAWTAGVATVSPVAAALASITADHTATADFFVSVNQGVVDNNYQAQPIGAFAMVQNADAEPTLIPAHGVHMA